jgi:GNAT superfamily N-acetyltransferase
MKPGKDFQRFPLASRWRERIVLRDGRELLLRPIHGEDIGPIRDGFALLDADEVRMRYQHPVKSLAEDYLQRLVRPRRGRDFALVLAEPLPPGQALVGAVARLSRDEGADEAEFAILVSHFLTGLGLGRLLMAKLITRARRRGLRAIHGDVLDENTPMLRLAGSMGFRRVASDHPGSVRVLLELSPGP